MADYKLTTHETVIRTADNASIPNDPDNRDRQEFDRWIADGGVPDPADEVQGPPAGRAASGKAEP